MSLYASTNELKQSRQIKIKGSHQQSKHTESDNPSNILISEQNSMRNTMMQKFQSTLTKINLQAEKTKDSELLDRAVELLKISKLIKLNNHNQRLDKYLKTSSDVHQLEILINSVKEPHLFLKRVALLQYHTLIGTFDDDGKLQQNWIVIIQSLAYLYSSMHKKARLQIIEMNLFALQKQLNKLLNQSNLGQLFHHYKQSVQKYVRTSLWILMTSARQQYSVILNANSIGKEIDYRKKYFMHPPLPYIYSQNLTSKKSLVIAFEHTLVKIVPNSSNPEMFSISKSLIFRNHATYLLNQLIPHFQIIIFTKLTKDYGNDAINQMQKLITKNKNTNKQIDFRLFRHHLDIRKGDFIIDLKKLNRPLRSIVLVQHHVHVDREFQDNLILVEKFEGNKQDQSLLSIKQKLIHLSQSKDVRQYIKNNM